MSAGVALERKIVWSSSVSLQSQSPLPGLCVKHYLLLYRYIQAWDIATRDFAAILVNHHHPLTSPLWPCQWLLWRLHRYWKYVSLHLPYFNSHFKTTSHPILIEILVSSFLFPYLLPLCLHFHWSIYLYSISIHLALYNIIKEHNCVSLIGSSITTS